MTHSKFLSERKPAGIIPREKILYDPLETISEFFSLDSNSLSEKPSDAAAHTPTPDAVAAAVEHAVEAGRAAGQEAGYGSGYQLGYTAGYEAGCAAAQQEQAAQLTALSQLLVQTPAALQALTQGWADQMMQLVWRLTEVICRGTLTVSESALRALIVEALKDFSEKNTTYKIVLSPEDAARLGAVILQNMSASYPEKQWRVEADPQLQSGSLLLQSEEGEYAHDLLARWLQLQREGQ